MKLKGVSVVNLVHDDFEDLELWYPVLRLREEGATVILAGERGGEAYHGKYGVPARSDIAYSELGDEEFQALLVPGGWAPDRIRRFPEVISFVREMNDEGRIIGQICHAGWVLASAGVLSGRTVTSTPGIRDDLENAGATWLDEPVVRDRNIVSSRRPPDLPEYARELIAAITEHLRAG